MRVRRAGAWGATLTMLTAAAVTVGVVASPAGAVSTDESYWVPVDKRVVVHGHGYGHGHGMSQYGAQGAALQGLSYREIVDFYYPGTTLGKMRGRVRVLITADTTTDVMVNPVDGLSVRDLGSRTTYELPSRPAIKRWRLVVRQKQAVLQKLTDRWRLHKLDGERFLEGDGEFFAPRPITLVTPSGSRAYRGTLRAASPSASTSERDTVNVVTMDQYVMGVVPHEMPASWHPEAVKSQAIAARTYATWSRAQNRRRYYQICDTTSCQVYGGRSAEDPRSNAAVAATRREILRYDGSPAFTQFSSSSGGWTSRGSAPYLKAQEDPYDGWSGNYVHDWSTTVDLSRFERRYPALGTLKRVRIVSREGGGEWSGRVRSVILDGTQGDVTLSGDSFRWAFGLRSTWFTIEPTPIITRWSRIGGSEGTLGAVKTREYKVHRGSAQRFERGKIFWSTRTGAKELYGPVFRKYRRIGGPTSALGLPRTPTRVLRWGARAHFENGSIFQNRGTGVFPVIGPIGKRYLRERHERSGLGLPVSTNYEIPRGERVDFEHGWIKWIAELRRTRVRVHDS
jgi:stage II sporulation protein D